MASNKIESINIQFQKRNARSRGQTSSTDFNASMEELVHDLAELSDQWNNRLLPLTTTVPNGFDSSDIDAFANGLQGRHLYVSSDATASIDTVYFNTVDSRPNTIFEQFEDIYLSLQSIETDLSAQIAITIPSAVQISIADSAGLYTSTNVETALAEAMTKADAAYSVLSKSIPTRISQNAAPTPTVGELVIWHDADDNRIYLMYNDAIEGVKSIELT